MKDVKPSGAVHTSRITKGKLETNTIVFKRDREKKGL